MGPLSRNEQACNDPESQNIVVLTIPAGWQQRLRSKSVDHQATTSKLC